nr:tubulin binding protein [uncultured Mediterranean phage uvMED]
MSELGSFFGIISEGQKQAEAEKAERIRIEEDRKQRLEPQVDVGLNDLSEFFSVMSTKKKVDALPKETKQEVQQLEVLSSFFEQMSNFENSLDTAIQASDKQPEVIERIVEVPVEKIVEKEVIVEKIVEVPKGPSEPERLAEAMSLVHKGQMLPEEKSELVKLKEEFGQFRQLVQMQLSSLGGGGSTRILDNDDVDISSLGNGKFLKYNSTTGKLEFTDEVGTYSFS